MEDGKVSLQRMDMCDNLAERLSVSNNWDRDHYLMLYIQPVDNFL